MLRLTIDNSFNGLCDVFDEHASPEIMADEMIIKMQLITSVHKSLLENVEHAQRKQRKVCVAEKGFQAFEGFVKNNKVKMRKPGKKKSLLSNWEGNWEGPYIFINYKDGKGS
jgi:hypothetical protein